MGEGIKYIDYYIPEHSFAINSLVEQIETKDIPAGFADKSQYGEFINDVLALESIRIERTLSEEQMVDKLLVDFFEKNKIADPDVIDVILIVEGDLPSQRTKNLGQYLQYRYKMQKAYVIKISGNYCANIDFAVDAGHLMLRSNHNINNILIVSVSKLKSIGERIVGSYGLLGDAAGIILLSGSGALLTQTNSSILSNGNLYNAKLSDDNSLLHYKYIIQCLSNLIKKGSLSDSDIGRIIIQNANPFLVAQSLTAVGIDAGKIYEKNFGRYGHLDCLDYLVNLKDLIDNGYPHNSLILTVSIGISGNYISTVLKPA